MTTQFTNIDVYRQSLEESLREPIQYGVKIPHHAFNDYSETLINILLLNRNDPMVQSIYQAASELNDKPKTKNLTFSEDLCRNERGRFFSFNNSPYFKGIEVNNPNQTIYGFRNAVGNYGRNFCRIVKENAFNSPLADVAKAHQISFHEAFQKGVQFGQRKIMGYIEENKENHAYAYAKWMYCQLYVHNLDHVSIILPPKFEFEYIERKEIKVFEGFKNFKIPLLRLSSKNCCWMSKAKAEFEYEICKGVCVRQWAKWLSLGLNTIWDEEKTMHFDSSQFEVKITGTKHLFKAVKPIEINISKEVAIKFVENVNQMRSIQLHLKKKDDLQMLGDRARASQEELDDETATEMILESIDLSVSLVGNQLNQLKTLEAFPEYTSLWTLNVTPLVNGTPGIISQYLFGVKAMNFLLEIVRLTEDSIAVLQSGADKALFETCVKKYQIALDNPDVKTISLSDMSNLQSFAFEELMNAKIMSEALKKGVPLELIQGDGIGILPNGTPTPEYVDVVVNQIGAKKQVAVQYKNTRIYKDVDNPVDAMVDKWTTTWQGKTVDPNLPPELHLDNVEIIVPKGSAKGATTIRAKDEFQIGGLKISSPSPEELDLFIKQNYGKLNEMIGLHKKAKVLEQLETQLNNELISMKRAEAKMQDVLSKTKKKDGLESRLREKKKEIELKMKEIEKINSELTQKRKELTEKNKNTHLDDIKVESEFKDAIKPVAEKGQLKIKENRKIAKQNLRKQMKLAVAMATIISGGTEFCISLVEEIQNYRNGKITLGTMAKNICLRTAKSAAVGGLIGVGTGLSQYGFGVMALSQNASYSAIGQVGGKVLGRAILTLCLAYQSYNIIQSFRAGQIDKPGMALQFARMTGLTVASYGCFAIATAAIASTGVGLAVGAVACIALGVGDHFLFMEDPDKNLEKYYNELREDIIDKAYEIFNLEKHCTDKELKKAYFRALKKYHPDKNENVSDDQAKAIIIAYELLKSVRN